jgi:hypothetical protein
VVVITLLTNVIIKLKTAAINFSVFVITSMKASGLCLNYQRNGISK